LPRGFIVDYLDRGAIAATRLGGITQDFALVGNEFQVTVSIFFVGLAFFKYPDDSYILMQVPSNLFMARIRKPAIYLPTCMIAWGTISICTAAVQSYTGLLLVRFFLGFVEAAFFPGCLFFLSSWYTRKELGLRIAILCSGGLISGAFSGLIAAGIVGGLNGAHGLRAWRWMFV
jgi:MFS family permease